MNYSLVFNCNGETAAQAATHDLMRCGFQVSRSFDLRAALTNHTQCACPHHGNAMCTCQFVVLLAYARTGQLVVITTHSQDNQAEARIVQDANTPFDRRVAEQIMAVLAETALNLQAGSALCQNAPQDADASL